MNAMSACRNYQVSGHVKYFDSEMGKLLPIKGAKVKISGKIEPWWWGPWGTVTTSSSGYFSINTGKSCVARKLRVQVKLDSSTLQLRTTQNTAQFFTVFETPSATSSSDFRSLRLYFGVDSWHGGLSIPGKSTTTNSINNLNSNNNEVHAALWAYTRSAIDYIGAFEQKVFVYYPYDFDYDCEDNTDNCEPNGAVFYSSKHKIRVSHKFDNTKMKAFRGTVLHELGHVYYFEHVTTQSNICGTDIDRHAQGICPSISFNEGFAQYFSDNLVNILYGNDLYYGPDLILPKNRYRLYNDGNISDLSDLERGDFGVKSTLKLITLDNLYGYTFSTYDGSSYFYAEPFHSKFLSCPTIAKVSFRDILGALDPIANSSFDHQWDERDSSNGLFNFIDRLKAIRSSFNTNDVNFYLQFHDVSLSSEPHDYCSTNIKAIYKLSK